MAEKKNTNPFLFRYPPNNRFINGAFKDQKECPIVVEDFGKSITDKESYRLSLAGKRGAIGTGSPTTGFYMFEDGKYVASKDFSTLYRKDLSVVEIDNYIKNMESELKTADTELKADIEKQIADAQKAREAAQDKENNSSSKE